MDPDDPPGPCSDRYFKILKAAIVGHEGGGLIGHEAAAHAEIDL